MFRAAFRLARPAALVAIAAVVAACVGSAGAARSTPSPKPVDPGKAIFRVSWEGGFVTPEMLLGRLPTVAGVASPHARNHHAGTRPRDLSRTVHAEPPGLDLVRSRAGAVDRLAREKDLLKDAHYDFRGIADAANTVLEINLDGNSYRVSAYALAEAGFDSEIAPAIELEPVEVEGRAALREFIDALMTIPETDYVDQPHDYEFEVLRLYVKLAEIVENSEFPGEQPPIAWPLDDLATAVISPATRRSSAASSSKATISRPSCRSCRARTSCPSSSPKASCTRSFRSRCTPASPAADPGDQATAASSTEVLARRRPTLLPRDQGRERDRDDGERPCRRQ